ncbi:hypothetical protein GR160_08890 [Flavobacterium sp. Sd200]|uniref:hypothetical protein n=1 Tax=Flavobacterium sp. Sd200 TaxID=2692211 RepID=UPI001370772A|nr:hypothetical protein [Flavobacterium sp. Sd200]MXN91344.1 hypothetical protein [Flavobacterium sp. Sd200]
MTFEIPFDTSVYQRKNKLFFDSALAKTKKSIKRFLITSAIFIGLGTLMVIGKSSSGSFYIILGSVLLIIPYIQYTFLKKSKKKNQEYIEKNIKYSIENKEITTIKFQEDYFSYKDSKMDFNLKWINFSSYKNIDEILFMYTNLGIHFTIAINEIGRENFVKVLNFLEKKNIKITPDLT